LLIKKIKSDSTRGIVLIVIGMSVFSIQDVLIKILSESTSVFQIFFFRSLIGLIVFSVYLLFTKKQPILTTQYPILTLFRVTVFFIGFLSFYLSLSILSLTVATILFFASPFFITILSKMFLKENIGIRRWSAVIVGFIGVVIAMDPNFKDFNFYSLMPIFTALAYSVNMIIIKKTSEKDSIYSQIFYLYIAAIIGSVLISFFIGNGRFDVYDNPGLQFLLREWTFSYNETSIYILITGLTGAVGFLCLHQAYRIGSPPTIAPYEYTILFWATLYGWLIFDDILTFNNIVGLLLIMGGAVYIFYRENARQSPISVEKPLR